MQITAAVAVVVLFVVLVTFCLLWFFVF